MGISGHGAEIDLHRLVFSYGAREVLAGLSLRVAVGEFLGLIGPNGSGKTTLIRCLVKLLSPQGGRIVLGGRDLAGLSIKEIARRLGVVPQGWQAGFDLSAAEVIRLGRLPHRRRFRPETEADRTAVAAAMAATGILPLAECAVTQLSGGEQQRVILAQALAQSPQVLLLDEPTAHLDLNHQMEICQLLAGLCRREGLTVVAVIHDLNLAARYCDRLALLAAGRIQAVGRPEEVLTASNLRLAYGASVIVRPDPFTGRPYVLPDPLPHRSAGGETGGWVHAIGGGGDAAAIYYALRAAGYTVTSGVLNVRDPDWTAARELGLAVVAEPPFHPIGRETHAKNLAWIARADLTVLGPIHFGPANLQNLQAAREALRLGRPLVVCDFSPIEERDHTGGEAAAVYRELVASGARMVKTREELVALAAAGASSDTGDIFFGAAPSREG